MTVHPNMTNTRYKDAEWLEEQYHENELSQAEIGDKCGVSGATVRYWMEKHDIERRDQMRAQAVAREQTEHLEPDDTRYRDAGWLEQQYHEYGLSQREIANKCGVCQDTVHKWMDKHNVESRNLEVKGVSIVSKDGYQVWAEGSNSEHVPVHRLLAVAEYGFDAVCDMDVHHQNGIKWDNRPDNIELMTKSEHMLHHSLERHDNGDTGYRDEEWLKEQYHDKALTTYEIAEKCDTTDSTIYKWMKKHGIESRDRTEHLHGDKPTGQLTLDDTRKLEGAQTVNQ